MPIGSGGATATGGAASRRDSIERRALAELRTLTPPASLAHDWKTLIAASESANPQHKHSVGAQLRLLVAASRTGAKHCSSIR